MSDENTPTFRRPTGREKQEADPHADEKAYFARWELRRQQRIIEARTNSKGLSIYERARQR
jgi:hypothetical protein